MLQLNDKWVWDFWIVRDGVDYHMFFLQANKSLQNPDLRHWNVSVGQAFSKDLKSWTILPDALMPTDGDDEAPDSYTTWTGCVIRHENEWLMYYTGTMRAEKGLVQRVCLATSADLIHWRKYEGNPLVELDPTWYDGLKLAYWHDASWRDPWVFKDPQKELYHMLVTCRVNTGAPDGRGAIGYASSTNLIDWQVGAPFLAPGWFGEMEVPQVEYIQGRYYLFCSVSERFHSASRLADARCKARTGLIYFVSDRLEGPWESLGDGFVDGHCDMRLYASRVIQGADDDWYLMGFYDKDIDGHFIGKISDPIKLQIATNGKLSLSS